MAFNTYFFRAVLPWLFMALTGSSWVIGQVQFPGEPLDGKVHWKAADVIYMLPPVDPLLVSAMVALDRENARKPLHFAIERPVVLAPETSGSWQDVPGYRVWRVHVVSPGARSLGLVFQPYRLEEGARVFVYDPDQREVRGAFTSRNNKRSGVLPVGHIHGEEVIVELQVPEWLTTHGELGIESVSHAFLDAGQCMDRNDCPPGEFGCSQACEIDVNCPEGDDWQLVKRSVVRIFTVSQYCTGVLINNTAYDGQPYLLTAEHCINRDYDADRSVFLFNYESPTCFGGNGSVEQSLSGCEIVALGDSIDYSLVRLSLRPQQTYDVYYAGWNRLPIQTSPSTTIHHPWGDVKKISFDNDRPVVPASRNDVPYPDLYDYFYSSYWWIRNWEIGSTEGGSSGSPLFENHQRIIGILSGGVARCGDSVGYDPETDRVIYDNGYNYDDYFTRIASAWDYYQATGQALEPWLDPLGSGAFVAGGYLPTGTTPAVEYPGNRYRLFPNPVSGTLYVEIDPSVQGPTRYALFDLSGSRLREGSLEGAVMNRIDTRSLSPGTYFISFISGGTMEHHRFLVAR